MTSQKIFHKFLKITIGLIWLVNGFIFKVLDFVPRHQEIVGEILGSAHARALTTTIGFGEIFIGIWVLFDYKPKLCAVFQLGLIAIMNLIEFFLVPELLLFGRYNLLFAFLLMALIYYYAFQPRKKQIHQE